MSETITMTDPRKQGNFRVIAGGLYAQRALSPDEWLERETRSLFASWKANNGTGPYASRGIANVVHEINSPHRIMARRIREAREGRVKHELVRRLGELLSEYTDRLYGAQVQASGSKPDPEPSAPAFRQAA